MENRIIMGEGTNPWRNLAVEALLFEAFGPRFCVFYLWQNRNTVVIGRHQNAWKECRVKLLEAEGGFLARRSSGGGAVFHDLGNLNFTFILPRELYDVRRQLDVIRRAVAEYGVGAEFTGRNDLVLAGTGAKFSGNAFRFSKTVGMHHGTLLVDVDMARLGRYLAPDEGKLRAKGIESVRARVRNLKEENPAITVGGLVGALRQAFEAEYGPAGTLTVGELDADRLAALEAEYASWDFRLGRALPFDATLSTRFPWGGLTLEMSLKEGRILRAQVYSDAMDEAMIGRIAPALEGCRYENAALAERLRGLDDPRADDLAAWIEGENLG